MDKPLRVRVAEALGMTVKQADEGQEYISDEWGDFLDCEVGEWIEQRAHGGWYKVRSYDTDWSATGPLIERFGLCVEPDPCCPPEWVASKHLDRWIERNGVTPLGALCDLILALSAEGVLDASLMRAAEDGQSPATEPGSPEKPSGERT